MVKEKQDQMPEEVPWPIAGPSPFSTPWLFDDDRIQEANRELEAYPPAGQ